MTPLVATGAQISPVLGRLSSTEERLLATATVVIAAVIVAALLTPLLFRIARRFVARRFLGDDVIDFVVRVNERFPLTTPVRLLLRSLQVAVAVSTLLALLLIWGQTGLLGTVIEVIRVSLGDVVRALFTLALLLATYVGMGLIEDAIASFGRETGRMTAHQEQIVTRVGQLSLLVVAGLAGLSVWNVNLGGLLVGAGFLGIVVGLAARQTIGSLIAGFVLMLSRPFEIGDWVVIGDQEGIVTDITIINTRVENFDGEFVVVPNDKVADRAITNRSQKGRLRLRIDVGIDYAADLDRAIAIAEETIEAVEVVEEAPPPEVFPKAFGDSAVVLETRFWIETPTPPKRWQAQAAVVTALKTAFDREGIKIPYPQRELSGRAETDGFRIRDPPGARAGDPEAYPDGSRGGDREGVGERDTNSDG